MLTNKLESQILAAANRLRSYLRKGLEEVRFLGEIFEKLLEQRRAKQLTEESWDYAIELTGYKESTISDFRRIYRNWETVEKMGWLDFPYTRVLDELTYLNSNRERKAAYSYNIQVTLEEKIELSEKFTMEESKRILLAAPWPKKRKSR